MASSPPRAAAAPTVATAAVAALVFNAFVWGVSWWPFRELQSRGLHPLWSTALVYLVPMAFVLAARPEAWRAFAQRPLLWLLAVACGLTNVGFNWGVVLGDVVRVVLLFYLMPAWSVLLAWPLLGEKPTPDRIARLALALAGVLVVLKTPDAPWPLPTALADWLGLLGGFCFALTNVLLRRLHDVEASSRILAMFAGGAALAAASGGIGAASGQIGVPGDVSWWPLALGLGIAFLFSNMALQYGAARLPAHTSSLVMLSEVLFASLSSVVAGAAQLSALTLAGAALIVGAAVWSAWAARAHEPEGESAQ